MLFGSSDYKVNGLMGQYDLTLLKYFDMPINQLTNQQITNQLINQFTHHPSPN